MVGLGVFSAGIGKNTDGSWVTVGLTVLSVSVNRSSKFDPID